MSEKAQAAAVSNLYLDYDKFKVGQCWSVAKTSHYDAGVANNSSSFEKSPFRPGVSLSLLAEVQAALLPLSAIAASFAVATSYDGLLGAQPPFNICLGLGIVVGVVASIIAYEFDLHSVSAIMAGRVMSREILLTTSLSFLLLLCLLHLLNIAEGVSRGWIASWYGLTLGMLFLERLGILFWARVLRAENRLLQRVAVFGDPERIERVLDSLFAHDHNLVLSGAFSDADSPVFGVSTQGGLQELIQHVQNGACDRIIVALASNKGEVIRGALTQLEHLPIDVQLAPDAIALPDSLARTGLVLLDVQRSPLTARGILIKSAMDYALGAIALAIFAPAMAVIAIAIKLNSPGPVFFVQRRHGLNHRIIRILKFRTMTVAEDGPVIMQAVRGDKRITRVGRFLRRTSLDELPQLINVLLGELSLVGPRPHALAHNESYAKLLTGYPSRHKVKPGITGLAQVRGCRGETKTTEEMSNRLALDIYYIENWSAWLDLEILARTLIVPFHSPNAH
jgi:Undecaprenyl-phosphate glucose phosphotransferase